MLARRLVKHSTFIASLSPQYMSGDETDNPDESCRGTRRQNRDHPAVFRIVDCAWRSQELTNFLRTCDALYRNDWADPHGHRATRGNPPRTRINRRGSSGRVLDTLAPPGLPINCYDPEWLNGLRQHVVERLKIKTEEHYDFTIPPDQPHGSYVAPPPPSLPQHHHEQASTSSLHAQSSHRVRRGQLRPSKKKKAPARTTKKKGVRRRKTPFELVFGASSSCDSLTSSDGEGSV